jgi:hypothetical protein
MSTKQEMKVLERLFQQQFPEIYIACNPRKYKAVEGYGNPKCVGLWSTSFMAACKKASYSLAKDHFDEGVNDIVNGAKTSAVLASFYMPYFWVYKDLAKAAMETDLPGHITPSDLLLPLNAFSLILPDGMLTDPSGVKYNCVTISKMFLKREDNNPALFIQFFPDVCSHDNTPYTSCLRYDESFNDDISKRNIKQGTSIEEFQFVNSAISLIATILVLMCEKPEIISGGTTVPASRPEQKVNGKIPHAPNWIGLNYRIKSEYQGGSHASPSLHWRRGHWREQAHGTGRALRKNVWIEPCVIGLKKAA